MLGLLKRQWITKKQYALLTKTSIRCAAHKIRAEANDYKYDEILARFRSSHTGKLVKKPPMPGDLMTYLSELVGKMISVDSKRTFSDGIALSGLIRSKKGHG